MRLKSDFLKKLFQGIFSESGRIFFADRNVEIMKKWLMSLVPAKKIFEKEKWISRSNQLLIAKKTYFSFNPFLEIISYCPDTTVMLQFFFTQKYLPP